jgi:hypothetical protein
MVTKINQILPKRFRVRGSIGITLVGLCLAGSIGLGLVVSQAAGGAGPTSGKIPESAFGSNGTINPSQVPDFVSVAGSNGGTIGYVNKSDILPQTAPGTVVGSAPPEAKVIAVYGPDLTTIIGHMYPGQGFVPLGTDPATVATIPATVVEGPVSTSSSG